MKVLIDPGLGMSCSHFQLDLVCIIEDVLKLLQAISSVLTRAEKIPQHL